MGLSQFRIEFMLSRRPQGVNIDEFGDIIVNTTEDVLKGDPLVQFAQSSVFFKTESVKVSYTEDVRIERVAKQGAEEIMAKVNKKLSENDDFSGRVPIIGRQLEITGYNIEGI